MTITDPWIVDILVPILIAVLASSGFWVLLDKRLQKRSLQSKLLIGLAHDRIIYLGLSYIKRGWITHDEHENLMLYLYTPYKDLGGNGSAQRVIEEVNKLPVRQLTVLEESKISATSKRSTRKTNETFR